MFEMETAEQLIAKGAQARWENRLPDAKRDYRAAIAIAVDPIERALALTGLGQIEHDLGDIGQARTLYLEAANLYRVENKQERLAHTLRHVADLDRKAGNVEQAKTAYQESLGLYRSLTDTKPLDLANALNGYAALLATLRESGEAILLTKKARELYAEVAVQPGVAECDRRLAVLNAQTGGAS